MPAILYGAPLFLLVAWWEHVSGRRQGRAYYEARNTVANISIGAGSQVLGMFYLALFMGEYDWVRDHAALVRMDVGILVGLGCFLALDFTYYWAHRFSHEWNFLWGGHIVHHSSERLNILVGFRQPWFHHLPGFLFFLPVALLGFPPVLFWGILGGMRLYPLCLHTEAVGRMPRWYEALFNTPSHHRVHHARDVHYRAKNYGAILIVWDRLFGTYQEERARPEYGLKTPLPSHSPLWANVHYYAEMAAVARRCPSFWQRLYLLVAPPGWGPRRTEPTPAPPAPATARRGRVTPLVVLQLAVSVAGALLFMYSFRTLSPFVRIWLGSVLMLSLLTLVAWMDAKPWARWAEVVRAVLLLGGAAVLVAT